MFRMLMISALLSTAAPALVSDDAQAKIVKYENTNDGTGNYHFSYETSNGLVREETGEVVNPGRSDQHIAVRGLYSYVDPDGKYTLVHYTADENGYQVVEEPDGQKPEIALTPFSLSENVVATLLGR